MEIIVEQSSDNKHESSDDARVVRAYILFESVVPANEPVHVSTSRVRETVLSVLYQK